LENIIPQILKSDKDHSINILISEKKFELNDKYYACLDFDPLLMKTATYFRMGSQRLILL